MAVDKIYFKNDIIYYPFKTKNLPINICMYPFSRSLPIRLGPCSRASAEGRDPQQGEGRGNCHEAVQRGQEGAVHL